MRCATVGGWFSFRSSSPPIPAWLRYVVSQVRVHSGETGGFRWPHERICSIVSRWLISWPTGFSASTSWCRRTSTPPPWRRWSRAPSNPHSGTGCDARGGVAAQPRYPGRVSLPEIQGIIHSLVGPNPHFDHHAIHVVPPERGIAQVWHADNILDLRLDFDIQFFYFPHDTPREMGGTMILPGSHYRRVSESDIARYHNFLNQCPIVCKDGHRRGCPSRHLALRAAQPDAPHPVHVQAAAQPDRPATAAVGYGQTATIRRSARC